VKQEERHVEFGEQQTIKAIAGRPSLRRRLLGLNLVSMWGVQRLAGWMTKRLPDNHPLMSQLPQFLAHSNHCAELRMRRVGLLDRPISELSWLKRKALIAEAYGAKLPGAVAGVVSLPMKLLARPFKSTKRLTDFYLDDPHIRNFELAARSRAGASEESSEREDDAA
jgi:hypothetical protein